ncbi:hypothetical protein Pmani_028391 [Petrolisthes manimaculis]|uniref:Nuclease HARBI1 n=1 Tax=Petrolisthes manimaculis TaxID=1843537 RepID=A0AAE1P283_9EUCA|nr:hypothetical protein Pmani_028391 [Petrolisthes manimaculis]
MGQLWTRVVECSCTRDLTPFIPSIYNYNTRHHYRLLMADYHHHVHELEIAGWEKVNGRWTRRSQLPTSNNRQGLRISSELQLLANLRYVATGNFQLTLGDCTDMSQSSVSKIVKNVCIAIASLAPEYIKFPNPVNC